MPAPQRPIYRRGSSIGSGVTWHADPPPVRNPTTAEGIVLTAQVVKVRILSVDQKRKRIGLSMGHI
ncbi:MAG: hypothetical protein KGZ50_09860 [Peptococcaceae bacterium]|nr:hypothetical protein [Peptococcaceae bacterium]